MSQVEPAHWPLRRSLPTAFSAIPCLRVHIGIVAELNPSWAASDLGSPPNRLRPHPKCRQRQQARVRRPFANPRYGFTGFEYRRACDSVPAGELSGGRSRVLVDLPRGGARGRSRVELRHVSTRRCSAQ